MKSPCPQSGKYLIVGPVAYHAAVMAAHDPKEPDFYYDDSNLYWMGHRIYLRTFL